MVVQTAPEVLEVPLLLPLWHPPGHLQTAPLQQNGQCRGLPPRRGQHFVSDQVDVTEAEEEEPEEPQEQFVLPHQEPTHQEAGSSSWSTDQWTWVQTEIGDLRIEQ